MCQRLLIVAIQSLNFSDPDFQAEVEWTITQRCNYSCSYCASYDNTQPFKFKTLDEYLDALTYLKTYFGNSKVKMDILGGEPTLFKEWVVLMNWMNIAGYVPKLTTNLSVPVKSYINELDDELPPFIVASFHPEFADLDKFCYNAEQLKEKGFLKNISLLGDPNNWEKTIAVFDVLKQIAPHMTLTKIKNEHTVGYNISNDFIDYNEEQLRYFEKNKTTDDRYTLVLNNGETLHPSLSEIRYKYSNFKGLKCEVGQYRLHIDSEGDVYPSACLTNYPRSKMGNIFRENIVRPKTAITCPFNDCLCGPDIRIKKWAQV